MRKKQSLGKLVALALAVVLAGCGQNASPAPEPDEPVGNRMILVDRRAQLDEGADYSGEYPAITAEPLLPEEDNPAVAAVSREVGTRRTGEVKAVWISYLEMQTLLTGKSESQFRSNMKTVMGNAADYGLNTVIVQVRPFGDALYPSDYFPWSHIVTGTEGSDPGFDPLAIMISEARQRGLRFEAWINPYRVRPSGNDKPLSSDNYAGQWLAAGNGSVISYGGVISYNPASEKARSLIVSGIQEIVRNYDVDGIHIDDYFYPTTDEAFDRESYQSYQNAGGTMSLANWRRSNVEKLIQSIYASVKAENPDVLFGISPQSSVANNYSQQYLDVEKIAAAPGYCDYLCPQIYFGFENDVQPFAETLAAWDRLVKEDSIDLYVGIAAYKIGVVDTWAGSGSREWVQNQNLLAQMVGKSREMGSYGGFVIYRYDSLFNPDNSVSASVSREANHLQTIM